MAKKLRPRYWDVTIHLIDRPVKDEAYLTQKEIITNVMDCLDLPAGVKAKNARAKFLSSNPEKR